MLRIHSWAICFSFQWMYLYLRKCTLNEDRIHIRFVISILPLMSKKVVVHLSDLIKTDEKHG